MADVDSSVDWPSQTMELAWWFVGVSGRVLLVNDVVIVDQELIRMGGWVYLWQREVILSWSYLVRSMKIQARMCG